MLCDLQQTEQDVQICLTGNLNHFLKPASNTVCCLGGSRPHQPEMWRFSIFRHGIVPCSERCSDTIAALMASLADATGGISSTA